ncbi:growth hormone 1 S homeolog precursor [Xenopus laevis]|uniref:Somatotropin-A n=2 Tax=Xenopus laevis TaxID=8355 RepID=SOMA1_XENLA|nr:growth hormone 1 S homeolog precursor [Xenopus laevis]P12855.2 RecName: Full=Somatotropin-A; AltName: Full=Growth hormone A; Short=GH-A; Flags: Precursor [Xenopus laevis]AAF05773.1 growth hormone A [Xenopus laevis]
MATGFCSSFGLLVVLLLKNVADVGAFPSVPLFSLFTNAVSRAQYIHMLAADTYRDYERTYITDEQRHSNKNSHVVSCYSETIPYPTDKDNTHQKSDLELLRFSLNLIQSWLNPVQALNKVFSNNLVFGSSDVYERLKYLEEGIQALMQELEDGSFRSFPFLRPPYERFDINLRSDDALVKVYGLLSCFKKDMHKVETYLKVMKCRRFVESNCTI